MNGISALIKEAPGTSLAVQWLRHHASTAGGMGLIPGWGTRIPYTMWPKGRKKKEDPEAPGPFHHVTIYQKMVDYLGSGPSSDNESGGGQGMIMDFSSFLNYKKSMFVVCKLPGLWCLIIGA